MYVCTCNHLNVSRNNRQQGKRATLESSLLSDVSRRMQTLSVVSYNPCIFLFCFVYFATGPRHRPADRLQDHGAGQGGAREQDAGVPQHAHQQPRPHHRNHSVVQHLHKVRRGFVFLFACVRVVSAASPVENDSSGHICVVPPLWCLPSCVLCRTGCSVLFNFVSCVTGNVALFSRSFPAVLVFLAGFCPPLLASPLTFASFRFCVALSRCRPEGTVRRACPRTPSTSSSTATPDSRSDSPSPTACSSR